MRYASTLLILMCVLGLGFQPAEANPVINEKDAPKLLYTLSANSGTMEGGRITLENVPLVVYFSDRPNRLAGHLSLQVFAQGWDQGSDSFRADPPNATLSILTDDGVNNVVIEISEPDTKIKEGSISFKVRVLEGKVPKSFGAATLFIDSNIGILGAI
jgi:hypothetical protein